MSVAAQISLTPISVARPKRQAQSEPTRPSYTLTEYARYRLGPTYRPFRQKDLGLKCRLVVLKRQQFFFLQKMTCHLNI